MTAFRFSLCLCVSPLRKVWPRWFGCRRWSDRSRPAWSGRPPSPPPPLALLKTTSDWYLPTKSAVKMGQSLWAEAPDQRWRRRPWAGLFSREWCELRRPDSLDLTGDPSFPRSLRGSKPRPEPSKMGKCDGRCTLLVICSLQLVSGFIRVNTLRVFVFVRERSCCCSAHSPWRYN